ncbi:NAD+ synthase [bacterium]|nr:NAD+ synthase [bacterium]
MRIALAQLDPVVGAFTANVEKIRDSYTKACKAGARVLMTPELSVCGYPPHDLVERPEMFVGNEKAIAELLPLTAGKSCALIVGHIITNPNPLGRKAQNVVSVLQGGKVVFRQAKTLLPTYDVFDEARYFEPATEVKLWDCDGTKIALAICEDLWAQDSAYGRRLYGKDPVDEYRKQGAQLVLSLSASPYVWGKSQKREKLHREVAQKLGVPLIYLNQFGATDEILFDGESFASDASGKLLGRLPHFRKDFAVFDTEKLSWIEGDVSKDSAPVNELEVLADGLLTGIRDYFHHTGFKSAVLGLSGGIDSAVVGALAVKALGAENVLGVGMPSQFSSPHSLEDAEEQARRMGIRFRVRPIKFLYSTASRELTEGFGQLADLALENLQSRLRGMTLMTWANHLGSLVLTTGNKSELATGYCTIYGDMVGALAPLGDLYKTQVYELARYINQAWGNPIPERSISRPPSAELRPNQKDQDTLPPYDKLDPLLRDYIEEGASVDDLIRRHAGNKDSKWVVETLEKVERNEFKRRQAPPVLKISHKAFGIGRRVPIAKSWLGTAKRDT